MIGFKKRCTIDYAAKDSIWKEGQKMARILVVKNRSLVRMLRSRGYQVLTLRQRLTQPVDLIITDIEGPYREQLREEYPATRIVVTSDRPVKELVQEWILGKADLFLSGQFSPDEKLFEIRRLLMDMPSEEEAAA